MLYGDRIGDWSYVAVSQCRWRTDDQVMAGVMIYRSSAHCLGCLYPILECLIGVLASLLSFQQPGREQICGANSWVPATIVGDSVGVPGSSLYLGPAPAVAGKRGMNSEWRLSSLPLCYSAFQETKLQKTRIWWPEGGQSNKGVSPVGVRGSHDHTDCLHNFFFNCLESFQFVLWQK